MEGNFLSRNSRNHCTENYTDEADYNASNGTTDHALGDFWTVFSKDCLAGRTVMSEVVGAIETQRPNTDYKAATQPTCRGETLVDSSNNLFIAVTANSRHWLRTKHCLHLYDSGSTLGSRLRSSVWSLSCWSWLLVRLDPANSLSSSCPCLLSLSSLVRHSYSCIIGGWR